MAEDANMEDHGNGCEGFRLALDRGRDGETPRDAASAESVRAARAHAESCAACRDAAAALDAVAARLLERAGPAGAAAPGGLREAVMARVHRGEAVVLELNPFLRRAAVAAAALFVAATAAAFWQASRGRGIERPDAGIPRDEMLAEIVQRGFGPGR
jgi:hypothetical protein